VCSFKGPEDLTYRELDGIDFWELVQTYRTKLGWTNNTNDGELAAFVSYALAFPDGFLALVDTYDTLKSGVRNFLCVSAALMELGHKPVGIRLDSGDLAYLSRKVSACLCWTV
jgi:nicotinate phosphoribosyltransferase